MKKILFVTGTRADFGKLKPLIDAVHGSDIFECFIFITGMHTLQKYGNTQNEIFKCGFQNTFVFHNQVEGDSMETVLANTILGLTRYLNENPVDLVVAHGDRVETLAAAITGSLKNIKVAHVEGGDVTGTIDEIIRHATSKLSHLHFTASETSTRRLMQMGESDMAIFQIGSPDVDVMLSPRLPSIEKAKEHYDISFSDYAIALFHSVTNEDNHKANADIFVEALIQSKKNYIVIFPNNDLGSEHIFNAYRALYKIKSFKIFPSIRFEMFLTFLKNALFIVGNSSTGVFEAPVYGVPTINIGNRQKKRIETPSVMNVPVDTLSILKAINIQSGKKYAPVFHHGSGQSAALFLKFLESEVWQVPLQKEFTERIWQSV